MNSVGLFLPTQVEEFSPSLKNIDWEREKQTVLECENYGFGSVGVPDHLQLGSGVNYEAFTILASLAELTEDINLMPLVTSVPFRNPSLVAKMGATIDVISNGRFQLGLGAGWHQREFRAYGYNYEGDKRRVDRLEEAIKLINKLWEEGESNFDGDFYEVQNCICEPRPQDPYLIIGGEGRRIQRLAKKYADEWNYLGDLDKLGNRASSMEKTSVSWFGGIIVSRNEKYIDEMVDRAYPDNPGRYIAGSPEEVTEKLSQLKKKGIDRPIFRIIDYPKKDSLHFLGDEVIPNL